jgi:formamidopyrimidine-DNA glycosylase
MDPYLPGQAVSLPTWLAMWDDLVTLMRAGVRVGRIETLYPQDRPRKRGPLARDEAGYVYRRAGLPCRVCGTEVRTEMLVGRNLYWCPSCQPAGSAGTL